MTVTPDNLKRIALQLANIDRQQLEDAGILPKMADGSASVGGTSWERFNKDPVMFILKLDQKNLEALAKLINEG